MKRAIKPQRTKSITEIMDVPAEKRPVPVIPKMRQDASHEVAHVERVTAIKGVPVPPKAKGHPRPKYRTNETKIKTLIADLDTMGLGIVAVMLRNQANYILSHADEIREQNKHGFINPDLILHIAEYVKSEMEKD